MSKSRTEVGWVDWECRPCKNIDGSWDKLINPTVRRWKIKDKKRLLPLFSTMASV